MDTFPTTLRKLGLGLAVVALFPITHTARAEEGTPSAPATTETPAEAPKLTPEQEKMREVMVKANTAYHSQDYTTALTHLEEAEKIVPNDPQVAMMRGGCYAELGQFDKAREVFSELSEKMPEHFAVRFNLVELRSMQKQYAEARKGFEKLLEDFPDSDFVRYKIVLTYLAEGNQQGAIEWFQKMRTRGETPELSYAAAALAISQGKFTLADRLLMEAEQRAPGALRHLYDSLASIDFVLRGNYPPRTLQPESATAKPDDVLSEEADSKDDAEESANAAAEALKP